MLSIAEKQNVFCFESSERSLPKQALISQQGGKSRLSQKFQFRF